MKIEKGSKWEWIYTIGYLIFAIVVVISVYKAYNP
jgi:hypothetical protein